MILLEHKMLHAVGIFGRIAGYTMSCSTVMFPGAFLDAQSYAQVIKIYMSVFFPDSRAFFTDTRNL